MIEFRKEYRPYVHGYWGTNPPPTREEAEAWRLWIKEVFMPLNLEMEALILKHSDLLVEAEMPKVLLDLSAHTAGYKPILKSWERGDFSRNVSLIDFPRDLITYAETNYRFLKKKQRELLKENSNGADEAVPKAKKAANMVDIRNRGFCYLRAGSLV